VKLEQIQSELRRQKLDGWLFFDHHHRDPLAYRVLGFQPSQHVTRRWYYLIPARGAPNKLVHRIESKMLDSLPGDTTVYSSWGEQTSELKKLLGGCKRAAMQYSPDCAIPYVSMVDAGTVELIRSMGIDVVTSAELIQFFEARLDQEGLESHLAAGRLVDQVRAEAFAFIGECLRAGRTISEWDVAEFVRRRFEAEQLYTESGPIVAVNEHAADPHYEPQASGSSPIRAGDLVLLDMWAKLKTPGAVYYDITWTGYCGNTVPGEIAHVFEVVRDARDAAIQRVQDAFAQGAILCGYEVDDAARESIRAAGFGDRFVHRTGHSIAVEVHGNGANMDNLETHDTRVVIPWSCFSIEPGVYLDHFGIRSEINIFIDDKQPRVTGAIQREMLLIR
jgi:Xaa-Pro aminopeptidase